MQDSAPERTAGAEVVAVAIPEREVLEEEEGVHLFQCTTALVM